MYLLGAIGAKDLVVHSTAGAIYGYSLIWSLVLAYGIRYVLAEASSRYVCATGESIVEGYGRLGRPFVYGMAFATFVKRHLSNLVLILLLGVLAHILLPLPIQASSVVWSLVFVAIGYGLMYRGGYRRVEAISKPLLVVLGATLVAVAAISNPAPERILRGLLIPSFPEQQGAYSYFLLLMAVAGTTVGSLHLNYATYVYEKGWRSRRDEATRRFDLRLSILGQLTLAILIQVAAAATFHGTSVQIASVEDLTRLYSEILGKPGRILFGVGMWTAVFTTFISNNTAHGLLGADFYERFIRRDGGGDAREVLDARRRVFRLVVTLSCLLPLYVLFTSWKPIWLVIITSAMFVLITPFANLALLVITSDRSIMKDRANGVWTRVVISGWLAVALFLSYQNAYELILSSGGK